MPNGTYGGVRGRSYSALLDYNNYFVDKDFNACYTGIKEYLPKVDNEMKKLSFFLNLFRILPAYLIANFNRKTSELVKSDIRFWKEILNWQDKIDLYVFGILLCQKKGIQVSYSKKNSYWRRQYSVIFIQSTV